MIVHRNSFFSHTSEQENPVIKKTDARVFLINKVKSFAPPLHVPDYVIGFLEKHEKDVSKQKAFLKSSFWFWKLLVIIKVCSANNRIIVAPSKSKKEFQENLNIRIGAIRSHPSVFGFVKGRSAYDCALAHTNYHKGKFGLLIKMDISNFFNSFSDAMITKSLTHHGFTEKEILDVVENCTIEISNESAVVQNIIKELIRSCVDVNKKVKNQNILDVLSNLLLSNLIKTEDQENYRNINSRKIIEHIIAATAVEGGNRPLCEKDDFVIKNVVEEAIKCGPLTGTGNRMLYQGGPSSPFLSNICFKLLDYRINAYVNKCGGLYTRYADDICLSFKERKTTKEINLIIYGIHKIIKDGGFSVNTKKTKVIGSGSSQKIVGYCVNSGKPTISKDYQKSVYKEIQLLKACDLFTKEALKSKIAGKIAYINTASKQSATNLTKKMTDALSKQSTRDITI